MTNTKYAVAAASAVLLLLLSVPIMRPVLASPRSAGYDHGCSDASLSPSERYINQPGKGPSEHTSEFMDGYNNGFSSCSSSNSRSFQGGGGSSGGQQGSGGSAGNLVLRGGCILLLKSPQCLLP
jgi:uncharacterized membrane protein YgcG